MRLIDVDALKEKEQYIPLEHGIMFHGVTAATIDAAPIVKSRPIINAKWLRDGPYKTCDGEWKKAQTCSFCNATFVSDGNAPWNDHKYCPECGASMEV